MRNSVILFLFCIGYNFRGEGRPKKCGDESLSVKESGRLEGRKSERIKREREIEKVSENERKR